MGKYEGMSLQELEIEYKSLSKRSVSCQEDKMKIEAELSSLKRQLKETMDEVRKAGFDPDNLSEELRKAREVLITKMELFSADLDHAENVLKPVVQSIEHG
jgi:chromosome segregation ATPase